MNQKKGGQDLYRQDGVNVPLGDQFSAYAGRLCRETYENCPNLEVVDYSRGAFRGPKFFVPKDLPMGTGFHVAPDGIGTKVVITDAAGLYGFSATDWVAMCCGDVTRYGGDPALLVNNLDVSSLGEDERSPRFMAACRLMRGLQEVANRYKLVMYNGETAEVGPLVDSPNPNATLKYLWSGVAFGFFHPKNIITGSSVRVGQRIVAFRERGLRSNAGSSARAAFQMRFGDDWYRHPEAQEYIRLAAQPSIIYDRFLAYVNGWKNRLEPLVQASLIVHLTGGSFRGKFFDDFLGKHGFSAVLNNLFDPPEIMQCVAEWRGYDSAGFYDTFHGGQGVLMVVENKRYVDYLIKLGLSSGIEIQDVGEITSRDTKPTLVIHSKYRPGDIVTIE